MRSAVNPPIAVADDYDLGAFSYGLAHEAVKNSDYYERLVRVSRTDRELYLDNGADELGEGMHGQDFNELIRGIKPDVVIAPDVLGKPEETLRRTSEFILEMGDYCLDSGIQIMAVAQGLDIDSWLNGYLQLLSNPSVDIIGIPYDIEFDSSVGRWAGSKEETKTEKRAHRRAELLDLLEFRDMLLKPIHLLGMNNLQELRYHDYKNRLAVISTDTTAPFAAALDGNMWGKESGEKDWSALDFSVTAKSFEKYAPIVTQNLLHYFVACGDLKGVESLLTRSTL
jgi:hypothetical protein